MAPRCARTRSVDLANDQMRHELGGGTGDEATPADVFDGVGLEADAGAMAFPFDLPEQAEAGVEPLNQPLQYSHIEARLATARHRTEEHSHVRCGSPSHVAPSPLVA